MLPLEIGHGAGAGTRVGIGDVELGLKYRFLHQREGSWVPDVAIFPKLLLPTAGRRFGSRRLGVELPLFAQRDWGKWSLFGGGGYALNPGAGNRNYSFAGIALTRELGARLNLGLEAYHHSPDAVDGRASTGAGLGVTYALAEKWSLIASGGPLLDHRASNGRYAAYLALAFHN